jgi:hypothetical protein
LEKTLASMRAIARGHGGRCISRHYAKAYAKLEFRCARGHRWSAVANSIQQGHWCPECATDLVKEKHFNAVKAMATNHEGRCISTTYVNWQTKLQWRCADGHVFLATPQAVHRGSWCPPCTKGPAASSPRARTPRSRRALPETKLAFFHQIAKERGGACLSDEYVSSKTPLAFRCTLGHEWSSQPTLVRKKHWCPHCAAVARQEGQRQKKFASVLRFAKKRGGRCLSTTYLRQEGKLLWRCARGHEWEMTAQSIGEGYWCLQCKRDDFSARTLDQLRELARTRGGICTSTAYVDAVSPLRWECAHGHRWWSDASHVLSGTWCPRCRGMVRDDLARMRRIARRNGGKCLSVEYAGSQTPLLWCCRKGHEWHAKPAHVVRGTWCRICRARRGESRYSIDEMKAIAQARGGKCLSTTYFNMLTPILWRCARGHEWETRAADILRGKWCRVCSTAFPGTIDGMRDWAAKLGGRCLSEVYDDPRVPARWRCAAGHHFEALVPAIKSGVWCPKCPRRTIPKPQPLRPSGGPRTQRGPSQKASDQPRTVAFRPPRRMRPRSGRRFTASQVREMRGLRRRGATNADLASRYGCSRSMVNAICLGSVYSDVE